MSARDRTTALTCSHEPENIPDNWPQVAASGGALSGMTRDTLSDKAIWAALEKAAVAGKPATINDGEVLSLIARPNGADWWRLRYWLASRENRLSLGTYPEVSLADARKRRDEARRLVAAGTDPRDRKSVV